MILLHLRLLIKNGLKMNKEELLEEIKNAYIWEGFANLEIHEFENNIIIKISGNSIIEHEGDKSKIKYQSNELVGKKAKEKGVEYIVDSSSCLLVKDTELNNEGDDYNVNVTGVVVINKKYGQNV